MPETQREIRAPETGMQAASEQNTSLRPTWYEIDLGAIEHNVRELRRLIGNGVAIYACLKRNAYGCGAPAVGRTSIMAGADGLAVGNIDDAVAVRRVGVTAPILLYPSCLPDVAAQVEALDLIPTISTPEEAEAWDQALASPRPVFLKIDVGLFRAGALPSDSAKLFRVLRQLTRLRPCGLYGHFYSYGAEPTAEHYHWQFANMQAAAAAALEAGCRLPIVMVSSTSALLDFPEMDLTGVDPGRLIYGLGKSTPQRPADLRRAFVALKTRLLLRKSLGAAHTGGFPAPFSIHPNMVIGVLPIGWGDGLPRCLPDNAVALIHGRRVPLLNPIHLEHLRIDLTDVPEACAGDEVVLIGRQGSAEISLEEVSHAWNMDLATFHGQLRDQIARRYLT